jgi:acetyl esterase
MTVKSALAAPRRFEYRNVDGRALAAYVYAPTADALASSPAVLLFHGGGWVYGEPNWTEDAARKFAALGMTAITIEYRLSDAYSTPADALDDACAAFVWLRKNADLLNIDAQCIAGYGVSAGAQLLTMAAARCGADGPNVLLLISPMLDLADSTFFSDLLHGVGDRMAHSPIHHVDASTPPTFIVQGADDSVTPTDAVHRFCTVMRDNQRPCDVAIYPGAGHVLSSDLDDQLSGLTMDDAALADSEARMQRFLQEYGILPNTNMKSAP